MNIGQLDRRITIETPTATRGASGGNSVTWSTFHSCWANKIENTGNERIQNSALTAVNITTFYIRYYLGITEKMRVVYDSKHYDITFIKEHERKAFLELRTEKLDNL